MIYAISDLHLSLNGNKPMEVFGDGWKNYLDIVKTSWCDTVTPTDTVLLSGDLSWAMKLEDARGDFAFLGELPGKKVIIRGNHDYWWNSYNKVLLALPEGVHALQNNALRLSEEHAVVCGSRGWIIADEQSADEDKKIYARELIRMQMALDDAAKCREEGDKLIVMIHYPPFGANFEPTAMTDLFERYKADKVIYGHIHGKNSFHRLEAIIHGIPYLLTSTDILDHHLIRVL